MFALTDAIIRDLLIGTIGNGLWALVAQSGGKIFAELRSLVAPPEPAVIAAIRAASEQLTRSINSGPKVEQEQLLTFLKSPELESVVRQLFATSMVAMKESSTLDSIRREFVSTMSKRFDIDEARLDSFATVLLNGIISNVENTLNAAMEKNVLSAHEAKSTARHRVLLGEIANLKRNVAFLGSQPSLDLNTILDFETKFRDMVGSVHAYIKPPHLESGRRVPIDDIFVAPEISWVRRRKAEGSETLSLRVFLSRLYRAVLLGNPGGGKSTVSAKICYDLATRYSDRLFAGREITPALVVLREYGSQKKATNCSIVQFLEQQAASRYQLKPPANAFEYLLLNGRILIIFDGLDELLDSSYRQEITSNVETFCKLYPSVPVLVTSREVGYEQAPLNEKLFELFRLAPFNEDQVREYADKWFARDEDYLMDQKTQKARAFFSDSAFVPDLRSNPLMLGLMCNLYRAEGYIPRNRPEVYGKCSVMLFERWDKSRDIFVPLPFEEHIRPAMQDLAFWIYSNEELQGGVSEHSLIERTSSYLCKWVFDDVQKAKVAASDFIRFCTGRAWVFTDTGTTREGERLFQFTHRTFLEYFTACYLVSVYPTPQPLIESLMARIKKGEWDVVAQLAFQIQSKQVHGAADALLSLLLANRVRNQSSIWNVLSFAERSLEFLVPSPKIRREITRAALGFWLSHARKNVRPNSQVRREAGREITEHIGNLLVVSAENRDTIADELETFLKLALASAEIEVTALAAEFILGLTYPLHNIESRRQVTDDTLEYWETIVKRLVDGNVADIVKIARSVWPVAIRCYWRGLISLSEAIAGFGIAFLLKSVRSPALGDVRFYPPGYLLLDRVLGARWTRVSMEQRQKAAHELEHIAELLLGTEPPWVFSQDSDGLRHWFDASGDRSEAELEPITLSRDANFVVSCLLATDVERLDRELEAQLRRDKRISESMRRVLRGRISDEKFESLEALETFAFTNAQQAFLGRWINGDIDLVRATPR
jgi:NACHT domain-containing protein